MAIFNGRNWTFADFSGSDGFRYVENWDPFHEDLIAEMTARTAAVGFALTSASTTSLPIGTGSKSLTVGANKAFAAGQPVVIAVTADVTKYMYGSVTSYNATTGALEASVSEAAGSGTFSAWTVSLVGLRGAAGGATLPPGSAAAPGLAVTGDSDTGLAQAGGANTLSLVGFGSEVLRAIGVAGGTNLLSVTASNGGAPVLAAIGASPNIDIQWSTKGGGGHYFAANGANQVLIGGPIGAGRMVYLAGSNGGNPTVSTTAGALNLTSATGVVLVNGAAIGAGFPVVAKSGAYTVATSDAGKLIVATGTWTLSLPAAASVSSGFTVAVKNAGTGLITVDPSGSELVDQMLSGILAPGQSVMLACDGTNWTSFGGVGFQSAQQWSGTYKSAGATLSNSNLRVTLAAGGWQNARGVNALPNYDCYWEVQCITAGGAADYIGVINSGFTDFTQPGITAGVYRIDGNKQGPGGSVAYGAAYTSGDVIGIAVKRSTGSIWFRKNGVWQGGGDPVAGTNAAFTGVSFPLFPLVGGINGSVFQARFSATDFGYSPPTGYAALS